jgi:co-chaperonin GroES (HSP10)
MKLTELQRKTIKPLQDIIVFKWLKVDKVAAKSSIILPESMHNGQGMDRMGHKYVCQVLAVGPKAVNLMVGDRFLLHEYDKIDQGTKWDVDDAMFVEEKAIAIMLDRDTEPFMIPAKFITDKMVNEYENY